MKHSFAALFGLIIVVPSTCLAQWVTPPSEEIRKQIPSLNHRTFESAAMKTTVGFNIILPADYEACEDDRYPVVFWLHGGGGNESSNLFTAKSWTGNADQIDPVILVYPSAFRSGYMDHHDGKIMVESMIINELIPLIDRDYRTIGTREGRAVHGFSMGSSGCLKFAIKYPDLFCSAVAYGGGAINLETTTDPRILDILKRNLDAKPTLIQQNNTYHYLERNRERVIENSVQILMICGSADQWMESAVTFQAALRKNKIPCKLVPVPEVGHDLRKLIEVEGKNAAMFQHQVFTRSIPIK